MKDKPKSNKKDLAHKNNFEEKDIKKKINVENTSLIISILSLIISIISVILTFFISTQSLEL